MEAIVAVYTDWGIGDGQTQPVVVSSDRAHFRALTTGAAVLLGRRTLEDFPGGRPLRGRHNIVITRQSADIPGAQVVHTVEEALEAAHAQERCVVIGGASVFEQFFPYLDKVYITKVGACPASSRFFPNLDEDPQWVLTDPGEALEEKGIPYRFCTYERREQ